ncbi:MAG: hypothetical protein IT375_31400 [Polyangiaceae bacterium]|nr:hypothetical protein [Polyangiaceae bacterium]
MRACLVIAALAAACAAKGPPSSAAPGPSAEPPAPAPSAAAPGLGAEPSADGKTRFAFVLPGPGSQRTDRESFVLGLDITMTEGKKVIATEKSGEGKRMVRHTTVLANDGRAVTKKKVRYEELVEVSKKGEREQRVPSPLTGKTYVIAWVQGRVVYSDEGGKPVSEFEGEALAKDNKDFGKPPQFASFVPNRPLAPGEKFTPAKEALADMFGGGKSYGDVEFTFAGAEERAGKKVGRFDFTMTITDERQGSVTTIRSKGAVLIAVQSGWPLELAMGGQVSISAPGDKPQRRVNGSGVLEMKLAAEYR